MAAFFFLLLAIIGGVVVGDLVWENTSAGEVTVFDRTVAGYPQGWLLAAAAALGLLVGLLLVASLGSTKRRRARRRQLRSLGRGLDEDGAVLEWEHASWLDESFGRSESAAHVAAPVDHGSEPLYEQTRRASRQREGHRGFSPDQDVDGSGRYRPPR
jgi:hypothetical protein